MDLTSLMSPDTQPDQPSFFSKVMGDPWFRMGMALLEQGGPQARPHSVGQDISRAVGTVQGQQDADVMRQQNQMKLQNMRQGQQMAGNMLQSLTQPAAGPQGPLTPPPVASMIHPGAQPLPQAQRPQTGQYDALIDKAAKAAGVDPRLFRSLVQSESNFNQMDPRNPQQVYTSKAGAQGLAQLMPGTAKELGVNAADPEQNLMGGARYLAQMQKMFGNDRDALRAYNAGPGNAKMSPTISTDYADGILNRLQANQAAPTGAPAPQAPQQQAAPQGMPAGQNMQLPPQLHRMFLAQAYAEGGGDPVATVQAYYKMANQYVMSQINGDNKIADQVTIENLKSQLQAQQAAADAARKPKTAYDEQTAKADADKFQQYQQSLDTLPQNINDISAMKNLLREGVQTGNSADWQQQFASLAQTALGIDMGDKVGKTDFFRSLSGQMLGNLRQQQAAAGTKDPNPSNADLLFQQKIIPSMENTPLGNMLILLQMERKSKQALEMSNAASAFADKSEGGRFNSREFNKSAERKAILEKYRLNDGDLKRMQTVAQMMIDGAPTVSSLEEARRLPPGTPFIDPNGFPRTR